MSNDEFEKWAKDYPWIDERRVPFMIVHDEVMLYRKELPDLKGTDSAPVGVEEHSDDER